MLHVVNTLGDKRFFSLYLDGSLFKKLPTRATLMTPEKPAARPVAFTDDPKHNRVIITIPTFNLWSVVQFE